MPSLVRALCLAVLALACVVPVVLAQASLEDTPIPMWVPAGPVTSAVKVGNTLVVGGYFGYVGPPTGPFAIADGADATSFNTASGLVHVAADGRRDLGFVPPAGFSAFKYVAMDRGRLFVVGLGGANATILALDPVTGGRLPWVSAADPLPYPAPTALVGSVAGNVVSLGWNTAPGNATTYVIEGGTAPGLSNLGVLPLGSLDTALAGAVPAGTYYFRMRAANAFGPSAPSNEVVLVVP